MRKRHIHEWKICTLQGSEFVCKICQKRGREYRVYDKKKHDYKWIIKPVYIR